MQNFHFEYIAVIFVGLATVVFFVRALRKGSSINTALRNDGPNSRYSLAKTQLFWWTFVILNLFAVAVATAEPDAKQKPVASTMPTSAPANGNKANEENKDSLPIINATVLVLLGISLTTTFGGKMVDAHDESEGYLRHQTDGYRKENKRRFFWLDLISDESGVNVHRLQALMFNLLYSIVFITEFIQANFREFPEFSPETLGLLALSGSGFLFLKAKENTTLSATQQA